MDNTNTNNNPYVEIQYRDFGENVGLRAKIETLRLYEKGTPETEMAEEDGIELKNYGLYGFRTKDYVLSGKKVKLGIRCEDDTTEWILDTSKKKTEWQGKDFCFPDAQFPFLDYEGSSVRLVLDINKTVYLSDELIVKTEEKEVGEELAKMVKRVYDEQPLLLCSVFQKTPLDVFLGEDSRIKDSIDTKLALMEKCIRVYHYQYTEIRRALKYKLRSNDYIDRIEKLTGMTPQTLRFIAQNPQYLAEVKRNKGIKINGKIYLPEKTLVSRNVLNYDTYENRYMLSFLKMLIMECEKLKTHISLAKEDAEKRTRADVTSTASQRADFEVLSNQYRKQYDSTCIHEENLKDLFSMYKIALRIEDDDSITGKIERPRMTAVFMQIPEYNRYYKNAFIPWFDHGIKPADELDMSEAFVTAVSNPNTTYELFIVVELLKYLRETGYEFQVNKAKYSGIHIKDTRYSDYAYEFLFVRNKADEESEEITLYYSPSVYIASTEKSNGNTVGVKLSENNVDRLLFRNTRNSLVSDNDETNGKGAHYEPDFIVKYRKGNVIRYVMADAKHKDYETVRKDDFPKLIYKYLDSIKVLKDGFREEDKGVDAKISGLCAVYNKHSIGENGCYSDETDYFDENNLSSEDERFVKAIYLNVDEDEADKDKRLEVLEKIEMCLKE